MADAELAAKQQIEEVLVRYASGIDRRDWPRFRSCFTSDVHADYEGVAVWENVDAITQYMTEVHEPMGHTMHRLSNMDVQMDGSTATARTYVDAILMAPDGASGVRAVGLYDDELVLQADGWKIARRRFTPVHFEGVGA